MAGAELWLRPWALLDTSRRYRLPIEEGAALAHHHGPLYVFSAAGGPPQVDGSSKSSQLHATFRSRDDRQQHLYLLPVPLRHMPGFAFAQPDGKRHIVWDGAPERPRERTSRSDEPVDKGTALLRRVEDVWARLRDVETALSDPADLWERVREKWLAGDEVPDPEMDIIVQQARQLGATLDELDRKPRRILRRTHRSVPIARVQEMDRRALTWLTRQPGNTVAERAGPDQRVLAVAREESFDTLENRVVRSYAKLASAVADDYRERNHAAKAAKRYKQVQSFERRCKRIARDLEDRRVREAEPAVTPNFALQHNPRYRAVWSAWRALLRRNRILDELWRWQARSWEEFVAIAVMVALQDLPGARHIAAAPLRFREEQHRGCWLEHDNPLGVFHLPDAGLVAEVQYRLERPAAQIADFGAPIWIRLGTLNDDLEFLRRIAIWPIWDAEGGLVPGEAAEIAKLLPLGRQSHVAAGLVVRPTQPGVEARREASGSAMALTLGVAGQSISDGIEAISRFVTELAQGTSAQ